MALVTSSGSFRLGPSFEGGVGGADRSVCPLLLLQCCWHCFLADAKAIFSVFSRKTGVLTVGVPGCLIGAGAFLDCDLVGKGKPPVL